MFYVNEFHQWSSVTEIISVKFWTSQIPTISQMRILSWCLAFNPHLSQYRSNRKILTFKPRSLRPACLSMGFGTGRWQECIFFSMHMHTQNVQYVPCLDRYTCAGSSCIDFFVSPTQWFIDLHR